MAETVTNRGLFRIFEAVRAGTALGFQMGYVIGSNVGLHSKDHDKVSGIDALSGISLSSQRIALGTFTVNEDDVTARADFRAASISFDPVAETASAAFLYLPGTPSDTDANRDLVAIYGTGFPQPCDTGLIVNIDAVTGFLRATST